LNNTVHNNLKSTYYALNGPNMKLTTIADEE